jgi:hypothetical protein
MPKFFKTSEDIAELAQDLFENTNLPQVGVNMRVMSTPKAKELLKLSKESAKTEYLTNTNDMCTLIIYEEALDRLSDEYKAKLIEGALSTVSYDTEKGKLNVDNSRYGELFQMRRKYPNYQDMLEAADLAIKQIADEEKEKKEAEKAARASKKRGRGMPDE